MEEMWTVAWAENGAVFTERAHQAPAAGTIQRLMERGTALSNIVALPPGSPLDPQALFASAAPVNRKDIIYHFIATRPQNQNIWTLSMAVATVKEIGAGVAVLHSFNNSGLTHLYIRDINRIFHVDERIVWGYASGELQSECMACRSAAVLLAGIPASDCGAVSTLIA